MDMAISQYDKEYLRALVQYTRRYSNEMLLKSEEGDIDVELLELWDGQLVASGNPIRKSGRYSWRSLSHLQ